MRRTSILLLTSVCVLALAPKPAAAENRVPGSDGSLRISISSALFLGMPESVVVALMKPFEGLLTEQTGLGGTMVPSGDGKGVANSLLAGNIDVGVLEGIEYAWERQKHPELKPLMITVNRNKSLRALVVVRQDSPAKRFIDLKGKSLEEVKNSRAHCRLFVQGLCKQAGAGPEKFFTKRTQSDNAEAVLDDVVDNVAQAAVIDSVCLDCFRRRKPTRFAQLKVIETSPAFPASVVVYKDGSLDEATRRKFQQGMLNANRSVVGRQLLMLWKLTAFELVPEDYGQTVANIVKQYPATAKEAQAKSQPAE